MTEDEALTALLAANQRLHSAQDTVVDTAAERVAMVDLLHDTYGWSYREIAKKLDVHPTAISRMKNR